MDANGILTWLHQHATLAMYFVVFARQPVIQLAVWLSLAWLLRHRAAVTRTETSVTAAELGSSLARTSAIALAALLCCYALIIVFAFQGAWSPSPILELRFLANRDILILMTLLSEAALIPILVVSLRVGAPTFGFPRWLPPATRWLPTLVILGAIGACAYVFPGIGTTRPEPSQSLISMLEPTGHAWTVTLHRALAVTVVPVVEELLFRGILYDAFRRHAGAVGAILITTAAFAAMHASLHRLPSLLIAGLLLALLREIGRSVGAPIAAHAALNW